MVCLLLVASTHSFKTRYHNLPACNLDKYCRFQQLVDQSKVTCGDFANLSLLDYSNCELSDPIDKSLYIFFIFPDDTILSSGLEFMSGFLDFLTKYKSPIYAQISLQRLAGIDLDFFSAIKNKPSTFQKIPTNLEIQQSQFVLYSGGKNIMSEDKCDCETYRSLIDQQGTNVLSNFYNLLLDQLIIKDKLCQYLFQNATLYGIDYNGLNFNFLPESNSTAHCSVLGSYIQQLYIVGDYHIVLDFNYISPAVFEMTIELSLQMTSVRSIDQYLFKDQLLNINLFEIWIINLKGLLHGPNGVSWISNIHSNFTPLPISHQTRRTKPLMDQFINNGFQISFKVQTNSPLYPVQFFPFLEYQFPDEDICLYHDFPFQRLVYVNIKGLVSTSCTALYLLYFSPDVSITTQDCNFTRLIEPCQAMEANSQLDLPNDPYFVFVDISETIGEINSILINYIGPIASAFGFCTNMLICITILYNHKRRNQVRQSKQENVLLEQPIFRYVLFNSIINSMFLLLYLLDYTIKCKIKVGHQADEVHGCTFNYIFLDVIGDFLKLVSNFSFLQISINRYLLIGKGHSEWLVSISQIRLKQFFLFTGSLSLLLSSVVYFQRKFFIVETSLDDIKVIYYQEVYYHMYYWGSNYYITTTKYDNYKALVGKIKELPLLTAFTVIHDLFSFFLFCLVSVILDILTVKNLHDALAEKIKLIGKQEREKSRISERKSIKMAVMSSFCNIVFRAPELISIVFYYIVTHNGGYVFKILCWSYNSCLKFVDLANVFYIISLCFTFFFYVKFNSVYKCSFDVLVERFLEIFIKKKKAVNTTQP